MSRSIGYETENHIRQHLKYVAPLLMGVGISLLSFPLLADEYLDALAQEAEVTASVSANNRLDPQQQEQMQQMEILLSDTFPATYKFYEKLYPKNKERVFKEFAADDSDTRKRMSHVKKVIMQTYFDQ